MRAKVSLQYRKNRNFDNNQIYNSNQWSYKCWTHLKAQVGVDKKPGTIENWKFYKSKNQRVHLLYIDSPMQIEFLSKPTKNLII